RPRVVRRGVSRKPRSAGAPQTRRAAERARPKDVLRRRRARLHGLSDARGARDRLTHEPRTTRRDADLRRSASLRVVRGRLWIAVLELVVEVALAALERRLAPLDEDVLHVRARLERVARRHDQVRVLADLERAKAIGDAPDLGRPDRERLEGIVL